MPWLFVVLAAVAGAQAPTGTVAGLVTDSSGGALVGARITITNRETSQSRAIVSSDTGSYSVTALRPGQYAIVVEAPGFKRAERDVTVEAGTTTAADVTLEIGSVTESVTAIAALPLLHREDHEVSGVVTRLQIEALPLNGRNFLDLAKLEPGVTAPTRGTNNRVFVPVLGSGLQTSPRIGSTRVTVDGASVAALGTIGASLQVSQEVVQEFQIATVNFDPATSLTTNGAVNIVTRSGNNDHHGAGVFLYRDHNLAAYPGLARDPTNPDPFFRRRQIGSAAGGPIRKDRAFFFASYERNDQDGVISVQPGAQELATLGGIFPTTYHANQASGRIDARLRSGLDLFIRDTFDGNRGFAPLNAVVNILPSGWSQTRNGVNQAIAGMTAVLSANAVNDLRVSQFFFDSAERPASDDDCPGCVGVGAPRIVIAGANVMLGKARVLTTAGRRYEISDRLTSQHGTHRLAFGAGWEHATIGGSLVTLDPAQLTLWSPAATRQTEPAVILPSSFATLDDILQLPLMNYQTAVGPTTVPQRNFADDRVLDLIRMYAGDTWHARAGLTMSAGLSWSYEPNALNSDVSKPALLIPILGADGLHPPTKQWRSFSPIAGFAWTASRDGRTVVRGGAGRYFDPLGTTNSADLLNERIALSPAGTTRLTSSGASAACTGTTLQFRQPTSFRGRDLMTMLPDIRECLLRLTNPGNRDFSVRNIDQTKTVTMAGLFDPAFKTPSALHVAFGVQRELARDAGVTADLVWRRFSHTTLSGIDYNRSNSAAGRVVRACSSGEETDVRAACSNGPILFDNSAGRAQYTGLLVRLNKRFSGHTQLLASYALSCYEGTNGAGAGTGFSNDDWTRNYGPLPTDQRHILNLSGIIRLAASFDVAFNVSAASAPPFSPYVNGVDFDRDGTTNDLLPGTMVNQFGRGATRQDLVALVERYNAQRAQWTIPGVQTAPVLTLPGRYSFDDHFFSADVRVTRRFTLRPGRVEVFGEVFNLFNTANLVDYDNNLRATETFGQPGARFTQVFGSGGPRAGQIGARFAF
jgi:hypothetical protein